MKRRNFIKNISFFSLGTTVFPHLAFQDSIIQLPYTELIGKGQPNLYGKGIQLRKVAYEAFVNLSAKALESDIKLQVVSSYRDFDHQNRIWKRKYKRYTTMGLDPKASIEKIIEYSTIPGTSRHHWATDIDIIDGNVPQPKHILHPKHFEGSGCYSKLKSWLDNNANDFGFFLVYTDNKDRKGFKYEPWHYSYKPLSKLFLKQFRTLDIKRILTSENLIGSDHFTDTFIAKYTNENILDINPELL